MTIYFIRGVNDLSQVQVDLDSKGKFVPILDGSCNVYGKLPINRDRVNSIILCGKSVSQRGVRFKNKPSLFFNQISDPDSHSGALERCVKLCEQIDSPVINHPANIQQTTRDGVAILLQGIPGVVMPRTFRFRPVSPQDALQFAKSSGVELPFIIRISGDHNGRSMVRVSDSLKLDALHALPFDGRDYYLTEYVDYKDNSGHYHKQRLVVIDGQVILRHAIFNKDWIVHGSNRDYMTDYESWEDYLKRTKKIEKEVLPKLAPAIEEIHRRLGLDYFGIDCCIGEDGEMLIFEANANMNILYNGFPELDPLVNQIKSRIVLMMEQRCGEKIS
ncbi:MAG: glutathione synthase/RimK-type ligase-like ATP-grasp enzyme [Lysobacterales bacterium]|jgi:glutathione synthase/RimK-type ligase-like ATP-grasp enzyme